MTTRIGAHVAQGSRNGYGDFCRAGPAVVLSVDDGGALLEARQHSPNTVTVFRQTSVYLEAPPEFNTAPDMVALARQYYPALKAKWQQNAAGFYTLTNEQASDNTAVMQRLVTYERELMRLANLDGFKVVILNLATGTPGSIDLWKQIYAPFIREAWAGGNAYGRHVYGEGDLVNADGSVIAGNPSRPFDELGSLRSLGTAGKIILTETGLDAGFGFAGIDRFVAQINGYGLLLAQYPEFVGLCAWTLGNWSEANWQDAIPALVQVMDDPQPQPPPVVPPPTPPPGGTVEDQLWALSKMAPAVNFDPALGLWQRIIADGYHPVHTEVATSFDGTAYAIQQGFKPGQPRRLYVWTPNKPLYFLVEGQTAPPTPQFRATAWPTPTLRLTQHFAANPQNYAQFGLPGHDGTDHRAATGEPIKAIAAGLVYAINLNPATSNYGIFVRIDHQGGHKTAYAHLQSVSVSLGQTVTAGQVVGLADSTGNSSGAHLHLTYKRDGLTYTDPAGNAWPSNLHDPWTALEPLYLEYLATAGITGYLWANSTILHPHFNWGFGLTNLNLRQEGKTDSPILGLVQSGVPFRITGPKTAGGYYPAVALLGDRVPGGTPPAPPPGNLIDLRRFKVADPDAWRVVRQPDGRQEDVQDMELGNGVFVRRKNDNGEWHERDGAFFYLIHDTSPDVGSEGIPRVYTLYKFGAPGAPKSKIQQAVGELWTEAGVHQVQFRAKSDCRNLAENSGNATNSSVITRYERNYTFNSYGQNLTFDEVVFEQTGQETQIYGRKDGRSCGWIGWVAPWGSSEPVEVHFDRGKLAQEPNRYCSW